MKRLSLAALAIGRYSILSMLPGKELFPHQSPLRSSTVIPSEEYVVTPCILSAEVARRKPSHEREVARNAP